MKKKMFLLIIIMLIIIIPLNAQSEDDFEIRQNADNTLTITGYKGTVRNIVIPDTLYGLKVTIIGRRAFMEKRITSVVIPETVITIQESAFDSNGQLSSVTLNNGLKIIESEAFSLSALTEIVFPDTLTNIGGRAFAGPRVAYRVENGRRVVVTKGVLSKVTFGMNLQIISGSAFYNNQIVDLNFPPSLIEVKGSAFEYNSIRNITFSTGLQKIGSNAFSNNQILELNLPPPLSTIEQSAFEGNLIANLNLPSSLKTIGGGAFADNRLQSVTIPNGVTSIKNYTGTWIGAFAKNPITTVVIPTSLAGRDSIAQYNQHGSDSAAFGRMNGSIITSITIPERMDENVIRGNFEESFVNFWINQNRMGGTYIRRGPIWTKE